MKPKFFNLKTVALLLIFGLLTLSALILLFILPYPYSQLFEKRESQTPGATSIDPRYMAEITGINTPEDMRRQYERHPGAYRFAIDDDLVVMFAYPDSDVQWMGMVFLHHFPSISEVILDYEGNVIYERITTPEVQARMDSLLNNAAFIDRLQNQMSEIWALNDPGVLVLTLVDTLRATDHEVEFRGGRPQTMFDAAMFLVLIDSQEIRVYEFADEAARRAVSDHISPDGYEFTQQEGEITTVIHMDYVDQPNFWVEGSLLVHYLGTNQTILELLTAELGDSLTIHSSVPPVSGWQTYSNPYFKISLDYPAHWQHLEGEMQIGEKFGGEDGYFTFTAMGGPGITLDQAVSNEVHHKLKPYGPEPLVEGLQIQGQDARLIIPSVSQTDNLRWQAALLVLYPQPVSLTVGGREQYYPILAVYADPAHIREIAESLQFEDDSQQGEISQSGTLAPSNPVIITTTPTPPLLSEVPTSYPVCTPPACMPDEMYHCPGDCPGGCGTICATATPGVSSGTGQVWGEICFPGDTIPEIILYFQNINTQQTLPFSLDENQGSYAFLEIPAGVYIAFAWTANKELGGGFTQFVLCQKTILSCTDHSLVPFLIREGHVTVDVDICDWETNSIEFPVLSE